MDTVEEPSPPSPPAPRPRPAKWKVTIVVSMILVIQIANWIASASIAALVAKHPMWLILMQPTTKNLLLVSTQFSLITFVVVATLRRQLPHPLWFLIGRWYGDNGIKWVKKRSPDIAAIIDTIEAWFPRWGFLICLVYPHPVVCAMAGASKMRFRWFMLWTTIGILVYVSAARAFGDWLSPVTGAITRFGTRYWIPITIFTAATTIIYLVIGYRSGKIESVSEIESELEHPEN